MPVFCRDNKFIHFIHIPKTGGASVQALLADNGWKNTERESHRHRDVWETYEKNWEYQFCVVRNPYDRIESGYFHIRRAIESLKPGMPFSVSPSNFLEFVFFVIKNMSENVWSQDADNNFWRPQVDFMGDDTEVFRLEAIGDLVKELKKRKYISQDSELAHYRHRTRLFHDTKNPPGEDVQLSSGWDSSEQTHESFVKFYKEDFEKFKYDIKRYE